MLVLVKQKAVRSMVLIAQAFVFGHIHNPERYQGYNQCKKT